MKRGQTPSQTIGPFFAYGLTAEQYGYPFTQIASGIIAASDSSIRIAGCVLDGEGKPVSDAMVEIWQAGVGFGRQGTGTAPDNRFEFETVKPRAFSATEAPHLTVVVFMRGLLSHLYTRIYFEDEAAANATDDVLAGLPPERRATLLARRESSLRYRFDIHLQGEAETVFFDL
jgi:protocatechuate 3,4-dioxygenase, alpha subunit